MPAFLPLIASLAPKVLAAGKAAKLGGAAAGMSIAGSAAQSGGGLLSKLKPATAFGVGQGLVGLGQSLFSGRRRAERDLMAMRDPMYQRDSGVMDFYQQTKNRAFENLLTNPEYLEAKRNADRMVATGMQGLQDRRSGVAGVSRLVGLGTDAANQGVVRAQQEQNRRFRELAGATQMKAGENRRAFDINVMRPFERRERINLQRLAAANARFDAGLQNIGGAATMGTLLSDKD